METREPDLVLRNAIKRLADEAMNAAAVVALGSAEHDFYSGVRSAAERHLHPGLAAINDLEWLDREPPAFRNGYLEASTLIAMAPAKAAMQLPLPAF